MGAEHMWYALLHGCFSCFLNCTNANKSLNASHMWQKQIWEFEKNFGETLDKQTSKKTKLFRGNHKPYINKTLYNDIMKRFQLKNKANKTKHLKDTLKF